MWPSPPASSLAPWYTSSFAALYLVSEGLSHCPEPWCAKTCRGTGLMATCLAPWFASSSRCTAVQDGGCLRPVFVLLKAGVVVCCLPLRGVQCIPGMKLCPVVCLLSVFRCYCCTVMCIGRLSFGCMKQLLFSVFCIHYTIFLQSAAVLLAQQQMVIPAGSSSCLGPPLLRPRRLPGALRRYSVLHLVKGGG